MKYLMIEWIHNFEQEPVLIYAELDQDRNEIRKIELFRTGIFGFSSPEIEFGGTYIAEEPYPEIEVINDDINFKAQEITKEVFEQVWTEKVNIDNIVKIQISFEQKDFLVNDVLPPRANLIGWIFKGQLKNGRWEIVIPNDVADEIRDVCLEKLQVMGFDSKYNLAAEGLKLEELENIFYIDG